MLAALDRDSNAMRIWNLADGMVAQLETPDEGTAKDGAGEENKKAPVLRMGSDELRLPVLLDDQQSESGPHRRSLDTDIVPPLRRPLPASPRFLRIRPLFDFLLDALRRRLPRHFQPWFKRPPDRDPRSTSSVSMRVPRTWRHLLLTNRLLHPPHPHSRAERRPRKRREAPEYRPWALAVLQLYSRGRRQGGAKAFWLGYAKEAVEDSDGGGTAGGGGDRGTGGFGDRSVGHAEGTGRAEVWIECACSPFACRKNADLRSRLSSTPSSSSPPPPSSGSG